MGILRNFIERNIRHGLALLSGFLVAFLTALGYPEFAEKLSVLILDKETATIIVAVVLYVWSLIQSMSYERRDRDV